MNSPPPATLKHWKVVRKAWSERIEHVYPAQAPKRSAHHPSWPWFDLQDGLPVVGRTYQSRAHRARRVAVGLSALLAGAAHHPFGWHVRGDRVDDLAQLRASMWALVQTAAGYEQVVAALFGWKPLHRAAFAQAFFAPEAQWPLVPPADPKELRILVGDAHVIEYRPDLRDGQLVLAHLLRGTAPATGEERIRTARGMRHLVAHGVLSPTRVHRLGLSEWVTVAAMDLATAGFAGAAAALSAETGPSLKLPGDDVSTKRLGG